MTALHLARAAYVELLRHVYRNHPIGWYLGPPVIDPRELAEALRKAKRAGSAS